MLKWMSVIYLGSGDVEASLHDTAGNRVWLTDLAKADAAVIGALMEVGTLKETHHHDSRPDVLSEEIYVF